MKNSRGPLVGGRDRGPAELVALQTEIVLAEDLAENDWR